MIAEIDPDVKAAAEFIQGHFPAARLVAISEALSALAPLLWGHYEREDLAALRLRPDPVQAGPA